jgi:transposase
VSSSSDVRSKAKHRVFTAEDKARIVVEYEKAATPAERAAMLRREGVYTSHIANWRKARDRGEALTPTRGRRPNPDADDGASQVSVRRVDSGLPLRGVRVLGVHPTLVPSGAI